MGVLGGWPHWKSRYPDVICEYAKSSVTWYSLARKQDTAETQGGEFSFCWFDVLRQ